MALFKRKPEPEPLPPPVVEEVVLDEPEEEVVPENNGQPDPETERIAEIPEEPEPEPEPEPEAPPSMEPAVFGKDPGGRFPSDAHRRFLAALRDDDIMSSEQIFAKLDTDQYLALGSNNVPATDSTLNDLVDLGYIKSSGGGYLRTDKGSETLTAPPPEPEEIT